MERINNVISKIYLKKLENKTEYSNSWDSNDKKLKEEIKKLIEENKKIKIINNELESEIVSKDSVIKSSKEWIIIITEWKTDWKHLIWAWRELDKLWKLDKIKNIYNFENLVIKYEDDNSDFYGSDKIYKFIKDLANINKDKCYIWIFDTDISSENDPVNFNYTNLQWQKFKKFNLNKNMNLDSEISNFYVTYLPNPKHRKKWIYEDNLCIEFLYPDELLRKYNFITKCIIWEPVKKFNVDFYKYNWNYYWVNHFKDKILFDWNNKNKLDKIYSEDWTHKKWQEIYNEDNYFYSKNEFANDIYGTKNWTQYSKPNYKINEKTWVEFLPVFESIKEIILEYRKYNNIIFEEHITNHKKISLFKKALNYIKNIFK